MRTPINNIGIFDDIPVPRYTQQEGETMTEITPLALKLRTAYRNSDAPEWALWNAVAKCAEAELAAPRPVRLPTVEEAHQAIADRYELEGYPTGNYWDWGASVVLDLVAKLNPTWVEVPPDATIPAGTRVRVEYQEYVNRAQEWVTEVDKTPAMWQSGCVYLVPSGPALEFPIDPRIEATARAIYIADNQGGDDQCWDTTTTAIRDIYAELAKAAAEALGVTL